ncbi:MAG: alpha-L-fucosidase, partial [Alteraurantiacibacter sp.]|nr:alpha-L-fucosidase [Alteraurantiacibacter sp.]
MLHLSEAETQRIGWFTHDRFGLFIHWGVYALAARDAWVRYDDRSDDETYARYFRCFYPDLYDPDAWAAEAANAGMKYVVITAKHHDGFCLWDSALTDFKATRTPWGRDLLRPLVEAFRARGLRVGFYYSLLDWRHPDFPIDALHPKRDDIAYRKAQAGRDIRKYAEYLRGQVRELLTSFGQIDILWFDFSYPQHDWGWAQGKGKEDWQSEQLMALIRKLQPDILVNDRLDLPGDFVTPEEYQPRDWVAASGQRVAWETCQTMDGAWGYRRDANEWRSVEALVRALIDAVSKGGNLLLNVGPNGRGQFDPRHVERLRGIGQWLR